MRLIYRLFATVLITGVLAVAVTGCADNKPMPGKTAGGFVDDSYLTTAVKTKLLGDTGLKAFQIHVTTKDQVVTLTGTLPSDALRDQAITVAKSVEGVKDVVSELEVKSN